MRETNSQPEISTAQPNYTRDELRDLDNFLSTYPVQRRLLKYLYDNYIAVHTVESVKQNSGLEVSFLELKALVVYKLLEAHDELDAVVRSPYYLKETARFYLRPEKKELLEAVLARKKWLTSF